MRSLFVILSLLSLLAACRGASTPLPATLVPTGAPLIPSTVLASNTPVPTPVVETYSPPEPGEDFFTQRGIILPAPTCNGLTQAQTEGPYYKADTPETNSFFEEGMRGTHLILVGYVLDPNCQPLPNAWLDFWQADTNGEYDNAGYRLRGHQFTDAQGRYYLDTILPGLYSSRPIEHIHVKLRADGGGEITTQLYFPQRPVEGLTVTLEDKGEYQIGFFNFVVEN